ncbi:MAG: hypothetical protein IKI69_04015 [Oscillospiraceae bacterium]|nr:hypothetical protein [Oscillospiraceae bacterium]
MHIDENTKLIDILNAYPGLEPKIKALDPKLSMISTPLGKMLLKKNTILDVSNRFKVPVSELLSELDKMIQSL